MTRSAASPALRIARLAIAGAVLVFLWGQLLQALPAGVL